MPIPRETLGLREASERFGVSVDTLRRRIKDDAMPEAFMAEGKFGSTWVVPLDAMADIAERERWVLNIDIAESEKAPNDNPISVQSAVSSVAESSAGGSAQPLSTPVPTVTRVMPSVMTPDFGETLKPDSVAALVAENLDWVERLLSAETRATGAETRLEAMQADAAASERRVAQLTRDLEHERAELRRIKVDLAGEEKSTAVAEARADELRGQLKRDRLDLEARIGVAESHAQESTKRADTLNTELSEAHAAMGWWSRRRLHKLTGPRSDK